MNRFQSKVLSFFFLLWTVPLINAGTSSDSTRSVIQRAMRDEMARNLESLKLDELASPFYISYTIRDVRTLTIKASTGGIVRSETHRSRNHSVRAMVGSYEQNDENFFDFGAGYRRTMLATADELPLEDDYHSIRRALWIATDNIYKSATEKYERKLASMEQQNISEEMRSMVDFTEMEPIQISIPRRRLDFNKALWENHMRDITALFSAHPEIYTNQANLFFYEADVYFSNSEKSEIVQPLTLASIKVNATTQAIDGDPVSHHAIFHALTPSDLPSLEDLKLAIGQMIQELVDLRLAPVFDDAYTGPVLFMDQAVAEMFSQRLFTGTNGLLAHRKPIVSNVGTASFLEESTSRLLEEKLNRRILSRDLSVTATPGLESWKDLPLLGTTRIDGEAVIPPEKIQLVENGMLRNLLSTRIPTSRIPNSNGHRRPIISGSRSTARAVGPSVISIETSKGQSLKKLKKKLLKMAKSEGLDYGIIIRKLKTTVNGIDHRMNPMSWLTLGRGGRDATSLTDLLLVYKVDVKTGKETLVRSVKLGGISLSALRHIEAASKDAFLYNTITPGVSGLDVWYSYSRQVSHQGVPSSYIVPRGILFEELDVNRIKRDFLPKMPIIPSPLAQQ